MLILIISGEETELVELKESTVKYGHQFIHVRSFENAIVVLSEYEIDGIVVAPGLTRRDQAQFLRSVAAHPLLNNIPISDLSGMFSANNYDSEAA